MTWNPTITARFTNDDDDDDDAHHMISKMLPKYRNLWWNNQYTVNTLEQSFD